MLDKKRQKRLLEEVNKMLNNLSGVSFLNSLKKFNSELEPANIGQKILCKNMEKHVLTESNVILSQHSYSVFLFLSFESFMKTASRLCLIMNVLDSIYSKISSFWPIIKSNVKFLIYNHIYMFSLFL